jgi:hypothetical protein
MKLDLHNTKHENVVGKLDSFIYLNMVTNSPQIEIITGKSPPMKDIVNKCLKEYGLTSREGFNNSGVIFVDLI